MAPMSNLSAYTIEMYIATKYNPFDTLTDPGTHASNDLDIKIYSAVYGPFLGFWRGGGHRLHFTRYQLRPEPA